MKIVKTLIVVSAFLLMVGIYSPSSRATAAPTNDKNVQLAMNPAVASVSFARVDSRSQQQKDPQDQAKPQNQSQPADPQTQTTPPNQSQEQSATPPDKMPHTASNLPLIGFLGLIALGGALTLRQLALHHNR